MTLVRFETNNNAKIAFSEGYTVDARKFLIPEDFTPTPYPIFESIHSHYHSLSACFQHGMINAVHFHAAVITEMQGKFELAQTAVANDKFIHICSYPNEDKAKQLVLRFEGNQNYFQPFRNIVRHITRIDAYQVVIHPAALSEQSIKNELNTLDDKYANYKIISANSFLDKVDSILNVYQISRGNTDIFEETLLDLAGIANKIKPMIHFADNDNLSQLILQMNFTAEQAKTFAERLPNLISKENTKLQEAKYQFSISAEKLWSIKDIYMSALIGRIQKNYHKVLEKDHLVLIQKQISSSNNNNNNNNTSTQSTESKSESMPSTTGMFSPRANNNNTQTRRANNLNTNTHSDARSKRKKAI